MRTLKMTLVASWVMVACISDKRAEVQQNDGDTLELDTQIDGVVEVREETDVPVETRASGSPCTSDDECTTGSCLLGQDGRACAFDCAVTGACPTGLECRSLGGARVCVDRYVFACRPCNSDAECDGGAQSGDVDGGENDCVAIDSDITSGRFCGVRCGGTFGDCREGYTCVDDQCRPDDATCECSAAAVEADATTSCGRTVADAECRGQRTCATVGAAPTECDAPEGDVESCDGRDNDCDDVTDEDVDCGDYACKGDTGCATTCDDNADCAPGLACDLDDRDGDQRRNECARTGENGTACTLGVECDSGFCSNDHCCDGGDDTLCCAVDADCAALDGEATCTDAGTNGCIGLKSFGRCQDSICTVEVLPSSEGCVGQVCRGAQCIDGGVLDGAHLCGPSGECIETADRSCDDVDPCTIDTCNANSGCDHAPTSGDTAQACYSFDEATRGVGACSDGTTVCQNGTASQCGGEIGPGTEGCNGVDDDCDAFTDEDTEADCFPYVCRGLQGCAKGCDGNEDCAAGNFCDPAGECVSTGQNGSTCAQNDQCQSSYCESGVCCDEGSCCRSDQDCEELAAELCDSADANGCAGTRVLGVCDVGAQCREVQVADVTACDGFICEDASCDGNSAKPAALCNSGQCVPAVSATCSPYACSAGACLEECRNDTGCSNGATCDDEECVDLPNGAPCEKSAECESEHCNNGFCCDSGLCCGTDDVACDTLTTAGTCDSPGACSGKRNVGTCSDDHQCVAQTVATAAPCEGRRCGGAQCTNIDGNEFVLEGITEDRCSAAGACVAVTRDCRARVDGVCTANSSLFVTCDNCSGNRTTCVLFDNPCACE